MRQPPRPPERPASFRVQSGFDATFPDGRYLPWSEFRYRTPPNDMSVTDWWHQVREVRRIATTPLHPMREMYAIPFGFVLTPGVQRSLHRIDRGITAEVANLLAHSGARTEMRVRQLIDEAITSSELEGARPSTREQARELLRTGRTPETKTERMIANNWAAMRRITSLVDAGDDLDMESLLDLHRTIGHDALDVDGAEGQLRGLEHEVVVGDVEGNVWHTPPPAAGTKLPPIRERVEALLAFANGRDDAGFVHPVIRAITCHFWIGYEHPFRDGNGRVARALFYWVMLRNNYRFTEFISISEVILASPKAYALAYVHTEADQGDLTYFVLHQLAAIDSSLSQLRTELRAQARLTEALLRAVDRMAEYNHRQRSTLRFAASHPTASLSLQEHMTVHEVSYPTAGKDLRQLVAEGWLDERRRGKKKRYSASAKLRKLELSSDE